MGSGWNKDTEAAVTDTPVFAPNAAELTTIGTMDRNGAITSFPMSDTVRGEGSKQTLKAESFNEV